MKLLSIMVTGVCLLSASNAVALDKFFGLTAGTKSNLNQASYTDHDPASHAKMSISTGSSSIFFAAFAGVKYYVSDYVMHSYQLDVGYDTLNKQAFTQTLSGSAAGENTSINLKTGAFYGISTRYGLERGDYSLYLITGLRSAQWKATIENNYATESNGIPAHSSKPLTNTAISTLIGAGVHLVLSDSFNGLVEYQYIPASIYTYSGTKLTDQAGNDAAWTTKPSQQVISFSLLF